MGRNRKAQSWSSRFGPALKAAGLCLCLGGAGIGYVWQKDQVHKLGALCARLEGRREALRRQNKELSDHLNALSSPSHLKAKVKQFNLDLVEPEPTQIVRVVERPSWLRTNTAESLVVRVVADPEIRP